MTNSLYNLLLYVPLYQLTFLTAFPKQEIYYEKVSSTIIEGLFEVPTLLVIDSNEERMKLNNKEIAVQLIQDPNVVGIVIGYQNILPIQEETLIFFQEFQIPIVQVNDSEALSYFRLETVSAHYYSQVSKELSGFMKKGFMEIASNLSKAFATPFVFLDEGRNLLWQTGTEVDIKKVFRWLRSVQSHDDMNAVPNSAPFEKYPLNIAGQVELSVIISSHLIDWQKRLIDKFIGLTALLFQTDEMVREQQERFKGQFIYNLLYHKFESKSVMVNEGKSLGWNLEKSHHLLVLNIDYLEEHMDHLDWLDEMIVYIEAKKTDLNEVIHIVPFQDQIVVFLEDGVQRPLSDRKKLAIEVGKWIVRELTNRWTTCQVSIGIGKWYQDTINLNKSYQEAKIALQFGKVWFENKNVFHMNDLGIIHLLIHIHREILYDFSQEYLSQLIASDREHSTEYVYTLKMYIQYRGVINDVADALYIHPNTLRNRLKRIEEITGFDLQDPEESMNLVVAIKIHYTLDV